MHLLKLTQNRNEEILSPVVSAWPPLLPPLVLQLPLSQSCPKRGHHPSTLGQIIQKAFGWKLGVDFLTVPGSQEAEVGLVKLFTLFSQWWSMGMNASSGGLQLSLGLV